MKEVDQMNYSSCSSAAQLLNSIPAHQPEPPKHSTPKKGGEDFGRPSIDQSAIYVDFDRKSSTSSVVSYRTNNGLIISEKEKVSNFLDNELQKRRPTTDKNSVIEEQNLNKRFPSLSSRDTAATAELIAAYRKMPKYDIPRTSRPPSSTSDTDLASSSRSKLAFEKGKDKLNFYCVPIGDPLVLRLQVWNVDTGQMRLKCGISDEKGSEHPNFKIVELTSPILEPGGRCEIAVQYNPTKVERNFAHLVLERTNCEYFKKTFKLIGDGGCAAVGLAASNYTDGIAKNAASSQAIVIQPDDPNHFWLEFENLGQRSAYVKLVATNRVGKAIPSEQICIKPDKFVLDSLHSHETRNRWKVSVRVCESFDWFGEISPPRDVIIGRQQSKDGKRSQRESVGTGTRDSMFSSSSSGTAISQQQQQSECAFRIETHWGEEQQRQRLKCWKWKNKISAVTNGLQFTSTFEGEQSTTIAQRQKISATLSASEEADFKNSLRQITFNVITVQSKVFFPQFQSEVIPIIEFHRNQSQLLGEIIPNEESCGANSATLGLLPTT